MRRKIARVLCIGWLVLVSCSPAVCGTAEVALPPALPADVQPLTDELQGRLNGLLKATESWRGLRFKNEVLCGTLDEDVLKRKMVQALQEELPPEKLAALQAALKAFDFIPVEMDLAEYLPRLLTSQAGGFYDPRRKYLALVRRPGGLLGKNMTDSLGSELSGRMEETVLVHELTHALQDQHFDLQEFRITDPLSDAGTARTALIEGDATLTMYNFLLNMRVEKLPAFEAVIAQLLENPKDLLDLSPDMPGGAELTGAPAWIRENLLFGYLQGFLFCLHTARTGGQKLLDHAYTKDPPRSSEQIMHPEKWHTQRDDPIKIFWPDLSAVLADFKKTAEGQWGQAGLKIFLRERVKNERTAAAAAQGWGGDQFAVYEKDGARAALWITEWDTAEDRDEFFAAVRPLQPGWDVQLAGPRRVTLVRGEFTAVQRLAVQAALEAARVEMPRNEMPARDGEQGPAGAAPEGEELGPALDFPLQHGQKQPAGKASPAGRSYSNAELVFAFTSVEQQAAPGGR